MQRHVPNKLRKLVASGVTENDGRYSTRKIENPAELKGHCMIVHLIVNQTPAQTSFEIMPTRKATTVQDNDSESPVSISLMDI